jgi:ubiquinone/menaquinone biosynthesis C-methylase UbiE
VPFLKPGLSLVDCGCGGGGLAVQLSERLTPGEVVGFDQNGGAIEQAKQLAASVADARVRFFVASVYDAPLPQQHFDIALFCGVLGHIPDPELALRHAFNVLKPGGVIAVRELAKNGDWAGGLHWETVEAVNQMHADDIAVSGISSQQKVPATRGRYCLQAGSTFPSSARRPPHPRSEFSVQPFLSLYSSERDWSGA